MNALRLKIAKNGIKNNLKIYIPYILVCGLLFAVCYALLYIPNSPALLTDSDNVNDGIAQIMLCGCGIIGLFSLIFLFYASSIISKSRIQEYGLYNLLGFSKRNLCSINFIESIFLYIASVGVGTILGIAFSKLAEFVYTWITETDMPNQFLMPEGALIVPVFMFGFIFLLTTIRNIIMITRTNPIKLIKIAQMGEKPPKANWLIGIIGLVGLAVCYYFAATPPENIKDAVSVFFLCAAGVVVSIYFIFVSLSVLVCKALQKNKKFYYKKNHFTSVSMLSFRMKKNGAGLASIAVFLTIIFVSLTCTVSMGLGTEEIIYKLCPTDTAIRTIYNKETPKDIVDETDNQILNFAKENNVEINNDVAYHGYSIQGTATDDGVIQAHEYTIGKDEDWYGLFMSLDNFNKITNSNYKINDGEILFHHKNSETNANKCIVGDKQYNIIKLDIELPKELDNEFDLYTYNDNNSDIQNELAKKSRQIECHHYISTDITSENFKNFYNDVKNMNEMSQSVDPTSYMRYTAITTQKEISQMYLSQNTILLFLSVMLSFVFLIGAVIIIYYKQLSEGHEDFRRFQIMKKVGMSFRDIKKSVNAQTVIVFMLPIILAIISTAFAIPSIDKMIIGTALGSQETSISLIALGVLCCGFIFYIIVYKLTSKGYLSIVSKN